MLNTINRVRGTSDSDWTIEKQHVKKRYAEGIEQMKQHEKYGRMGFAKMLHARGFWPDEPGLYQNRAMLANEVLGLP